MGLFNEILSVVAAVGRIACALSGELGVSPAFLDFGPVASSAVALRTAQIALLHSELNACPQRWAAYQIWGGA